MFLSEPLTHLFGVQSEFHESLFSNDNKLNTFSSHS